MIGELPNPVRLFYYGISPHGLHVEIIDRRNRDKKHLVVLVDENGDPVTIPQGSRFQHVSSGEEMNLLENRLRELSRLQNAQQEAIA